MVLELNKKEIGLGIAFGLALAFFISFWAIASALLCGLFWALSGSGEGKFWRTALIPASTAGFFWLAGYHQFYGVWHIGIGIAVAIVLAQGYGIPDPPSRPDPDKGSPLGRFFYKLTGQRELPATLLTRTTLALILGLCFLPLVLVHKNFLGFIGVLTVAHLVIVWLIDGNWIIKI